MVDTAPASGTRDFLPREAARRRRAFAAVREVFERYGFLPMDTPAFERLDVLMGKYGQEGDQLIFKILRRGDHEGSGEADLALRYDHTVPMARYVASNLGELGTPFKRYVVAPVWRADRPGRGRFREFVQCDIDTVGSDSPLADAETILAVAEGLSALGLEEFTVLLNDRGALRGLIEAYGVPEALEETALVALDKLDKIGPAGVVADLEDRGVPAGAVARLAEDLQAPDSSERIRERVGATERGRRGLEQIDDVTALTAPYLAVGEIEFAPLLARGLSYYTGPIFEIVHEGLDATIGAGGRYDELVGMFMGNDYPATGGSIGLERVLMLLDDDAGPVGAPVVVTVMDDAGRGEATALGRRLRDAGIGADVFPGVGRLGKQLTYADRRGARMALIRGSEERAAGTVAVKDLVSGDQEPVDEDAVVDVLRARLATGPDGGGR